MTQFKDFNLDPSLLSAIEEMGYEAPTSIQQMAIPYLLENEGDLVALAATGTGKTASFGLPLLQKIDRTIGEPQALILTPTRELSTQVVNDLKKYSANLKGVRVTGIIGGASMEKQISELRKGSQIIVATPGRLIDLIKRRKINISQIQNVVLDEADEMLNMGFQDDISEILSGLPKERRLILFSATMPRQVRKIASDFMKNPFEIGKSAEHNASGGVRHTYFRVKAHNKYAALKRIADANPLIYAIVFCKTKNETGEIAEKLIKDGYNADSLHGDLSHAQREQVMNRFHSRSVQILVATDVAARGLHVTDLTHVINYNLPTEPELYTHRSGRTGRAGKTGISISIINLREERKLLQYGKQIGIDFQREIIPSGSDICRNQMKHYMNRILNTEIKEKLLEPVSEELTAMAESMTKEELLYRFLSDKFGDMLKYYDGSPNLNITDEMDTSGDSRSSRGGDRNRGGYRGGRGYSSGGSGNRRYSDSGSRGGKKSTRKSGSSKKPAARR